MGGGQGAQDTYSPDVSQAAIQGVFVLSLENSASSDLRGLNSHVGFFKSSFQDIKMRCNEVRRLVHDPGLLELQG